MSTLFYRWLILLTLGSVLPGSRAADSLTDALAVIRAVGPEGQGNVAAQSAWKTIVQADTGRVLDLLSAMNGANGLAANWLRAGVETIVARSVQQGQRMPVAALEAFVADHRNDPQPRRLAYELIATADRERAERIITGMVNDPGPELRRDAIQRRIEAAMQMQSDGQSEAAIRILQSALPNAREADQVDAIARALRELEQPVDLPAVFGWLTEWSVIGPFDNTGGRGFERVFPPEEKQAPEGEYEGKNGTVRWQEARAAGDYGLLDLNKPMGALKGVTGYALATLESDEARPVEVRLGSKNAWKVWLNGRLLRGREEYHRAMEIDQYRLAGALRKGTNTILVKVCQNEQTEDWTVEWEFQMRLTDTLGTPIRLTRSSSQPSSP